MAANLPSSSLLVRCRQVLQRARQALGARGLPSDGDPLAALEAKLAAHRLTVAVFGLVGRGKSAVINALIDEPRLASGPLHGVTRWPRSVYWTPANTADPWQVELIDTPGLDEIAGAARAEMAQAVAQQADLILFVVAGAVSAVEVEALYQLGHTHKPLVLVANKADRYPPLDRAALERQLAERGPLLALDAVVHVAACPDPRPVRTEWPDGRVSETWESPPAEIEPLRRTLLNLLQQDAPALVVLNALQQAREVEQTLVQHTLTVHHDEAEALIFRFAQYKALAVALNPVAGLDVVANAMTDLVLIRRLAQLYGLPITAFEAGNLWRAILSSSGVLVASEVGAVLLGVGKSSLFLGTAALTGLGGGGAGLTAVVGTMVAQAGAAGYGTYAVGRATKRYLERGCTWGPAGLSTTLAEVLQDLDQAPALARLQGYLVATLGVAPSGKSAPVPSPGDGLSGQLPVDDPPSGSV